MAHRVARNNNQSDPPATVRCDTSLYASHNTSPDCVPTIISPLLPAAAITVGAAVECNSLCITWPPWHRWHCPRHLSLRLLLLPACLLPVSPRPPLEPSQPSTDTSWSPRSSAAAWSSLLLALMLLLLLAAQRCLRPCQLPKSTAASDADTSTAASPPAACTCEGSCSTPCAYSTLPLLSQQPCAPECDNKPLRGPAVAWLIPLLLPPPPLLPVFACGSPSTSSKGTCCSTLPVNRSNRPTCWQQRGFINRVANEQAHDQHAVCCEGEALHDEDCVTCYALQRRLPVCLPV